MSYLLYGSKNGPIDLKFLPGVLRDLYFVNISKTAFKTAQKQTRYIHFNGYYKWRENATI